MGRGVINHSLQIIRGRATMIPTDSFPFWNDRLPGQGWQAPAAIVIEEWAQASGPEFPKGDPGSRGSRVASRPESGHAGSIWIEKNCGAPCSA